MNRKLSLFALCTVSLGMCVSLSSSSSPSQTPSLQPLTSASSGSIALSGNSFWPSNLSLPSEATLYKALALGTAGYLAYRYWQGQQARKQREQMQRLQNLAQPGQLQRPVLPAAAEPQKASNAEIYQAENYRIYQALLAKRDKEASAATEELMKKGLKKDIPVALPSKSDREIVLDQLRAGEKNSIPLKAQLQGADLKNIDLQGVNFNSADLSGANLSQDTRPATGKGSGNRSLRNTNLSNVNLTGANLTNANLYSADLAGADLTRASLSQAEFSQVQNFTKIKSLQNANFDGATGLSDDEINYARRHGAINVPSSWQEKRVLEQKKPMTRLAQKLAQADADSEQYYLKEEKMMRDRVQNEQNPEIKKKLENSLKGYLEALRLRVNNDLWDERMAIRNNEERENLLRQGNEE